MSVSGGRRPSSSRSKSNEGDCIERLHAAGLLDVYWHGKVEADKVTTGTFQVKEGGMFALVDSPRISLYRLLLTQARGLSRSLTIPFRNKSRSLLPSYFSPTPPHPLLQRLMLFITSTPIQLLPRPHHWQRRAERSPPLDLMHLLKPFPFRTQKTPDTIGKLFTRHTGSIPASSRNESANGTRVMRGVSSHWTSPLQHCHIT